MKKPNLKLRRLKVGERLRVADWFVPKGKTKGEGWLQNPTNADKKVRIVKKTDLCWYYRTA